MDLREELGAAIDAADTPDAGTTPTPPSEPAAPAGEPVSAGSGEAPAAQPADATKPVAGGERPRDASGRFLKAGEQSAAAQEQQPVSQEGAAQPAPGAQAQAGEAPQQPQGVDLPPSTWSAAAKAEYGKLPATVRTEIKKREADFQKGITQYKQAAEHGQALMNEIQPYLAMIQAEGGTPERAVKSLLNTAYLLRTSSPQQKGQMIMQIAQQYGADLSQFFQGQPQGEQGQQSPLDPRSLAPLVQQLIQPYVQPLQQFQQQFLTAEQQRQAQHEQETNSQIEAFQTAADDKGQPKHVYFDNVRGIMAGLIENGYANTLEDAYAMACRAHPEVSQALAAEQRQAQESQRLEEARRKAAEAAHANQANVTGQGGVGIANATKLTLRDELASHLDGASARI